MQIALFPVFHGVAESIVVTSSAVVSVWSASFQSFVLQQNVRYSVIALVCYTRKLSHLRIVSQQEERFQGYQFDLQCRSYPVPE